VKMDDRRRLHELTKNDLQTELVTAERELLDHQFDKGLKRLTNPAALHNARKRVARLKTLIRQHELLEETGLGSMDEYKAFRVTERREFVSRKNAR